MESTMMRSMPGSISVARSIPVGLAALLLAACASTPERVPEIEQARQAVQELEQQPEAGAVAAESLSRAREALATAESLHNEGEPLPLIQHQAYLAHRHAQIGLEMVNEAKSLEQIRAGEARRSEMQLEARTLEAERAEMAARRQAGEAQRQREAAKGSRAAAAAAMLETERLERELADLEAEQTERGIVLTLSDAVLFATDSDELKSGAYRALDRLADFLEDNPERRLLIEGHTDARGTDEYNQDLSERRAESVAEALMERGIASDRLRPVGLGEEYPVASNETSAGQQQNRRVEVVISKDDGTFPPAADRTVAREARERR